MKRQSQSSRAGYFLVDMMIALALLGVVAIVASKLLVTTLNAPVEAQTRAETADRFDLAMDRLRADVWSAERIESDGASATLRQPDGRKVTWRIEPANPTGSNVNLSRHAEAGDGKAAPEDMRWTDLPPGMAFSAAGAILHVRPPNAAPGADDLGRLSMVSQLQLAGRTP